MKNLQEDNKEIKDEMKNLQEDNKEIKDEMKNLQEDNKEIKNEMKNLQEDNKEIKSEMRKMQEEIHIVKDVNLPHILQNQTELKVEVKEIGKKLDKTNQILEEYIKKHEVEHKKIEYEIANLKWKIAN